MRRAFERHGLPSLPAPQVTARCPRRTASAFCTCRAACCLRGRGRAGNGVWVPGQKPQGPHRQTGAVQPVPCDLEGQPASGDRPPATRLPACVGDVAPPAPRTPPPCIRSQRRSAEPVTLTASPRPESVSSAFFVILRILFLAFKNVTPGRVAMSPASGLGGRGQGLGSVTSPRARAASSATLLSCSLRSPGHGPAERAGEPADGQPAGGHLGAAARREPERERAGLQGNALSRRLLAPGPPMPGRAA